MQTTAVYAGTFDPITVGHVNIVQRALKLFDKLIIAVAESADKHPLFSQQARVDLVAQVLAHKTNLRVVPFCGLLVDFMSKHACTTLIRGVRNAQDMIYESQLAFANRALYPAIETVFLQAEPAFSCISASLIREIAHMRGDITPFVPACIVEKIKERHHGT